MRNFTLWCLAFLFISSVVWMANKAVERTKASKKVKEKASMLNELPIFSMDSMKYEMPKETKPVVLILFNTGCEHCQYETSQIKKSIASFSRSSIVMISSETLTTIEEFSVRYGLSDQPNISFCKINAENVFETFGSGVIPRIFIYGRDRKLIKEFKGETKIEAILKYIQ